MSFQKVENRMDDITAECCLDRWHSGGDVELNEDELSLELIEDEDVPLVDGVLEGAFGDLGCCCGDGVLSHIWLELERNPWKSLRLKMN
ncbi:hypothetical protein Tco_0789714 [Tanacetum coccineum]